MEAGDAVVAGVTMVTLDVGPEVSISGAPVVEDERTGTAVRGADRVQCDAAGADTAVVCETAVTLQSVTDTPSHAVWLTAAAADI